MSFFDDMYFKLFVYLSNVSTAYPWHILDIDEHNKQKQYTHGGYIPLGKKPQTKIDFGRYYDEVETMLKQQRNPRKLLSITCSGKGSLRRQH